MTVNSTRDVLIIGAGLAGCCLAAELSDFGLSSFILGDSRKASATVAGGVINPVSGKRFGSDARFDERRALAKARYESLGRVWRDIDILRVLDSDEEQRHFERKRPLLEERQLVSLVDEAEWNSRVSATLCNRPASPVLRFHRAAVVDCSSALRAFYRHYQECKQLDFVSTHDANHAAESLSYNGLSFRWVVYCEGWRIGENPYFAYVPTMFAKGQVIELQSEGLEGLRDILVQHAKFLLPLTGNQALFGATYEWNEINDDVSDNTSTYLREALTNHYHPTFQITAARAGVRPIMRDLQPVVGAHPEHPHRFILNGLGSKGALLAPALSRELVLHLVEGRALDTAVSVRRFDGAFEDSRSSSQTNLHGEHNDAH